MLNETYISPFADRYASQEMLRLFSPKYKYTTWRKLWVALAKAQQMLGVEISSGQIEEMSASVDLIDWDRVAAYEKQFQHEVVAHLHAYCDQCPAARPIIHLGATSCYLTDNADLIQMKEALKLLIAKLAKVIALLVKFAQRYATMPCLSFTHFQPAQPTTIGKRACLWIQDLLLDFQDLELRTTQLRFLGVKGATGTQASFLALFEGNEEKVKTLDQLVASMMGFTQVFLISGQTYTRKQDVQVINALAGVAISAHKIGSDLRLLSHLKELEEPFEEKQIGSSAMPFKRNPILSERLCALARFLISLAENPAYTAATQWLERTLDDSANRRLCLPEAFLCCDSLLEILLRLGRGMVVNEAVVARHLAEELPFIATENILIEGVKRGGDRQELHARLKKHTFEVSERMKQEGGSNDLLVRLAADPSFRMTLEELEQLIDRAQFVGRAAEQVEEFCNSSYVKRDG